MTWAPQRRKRTCDYVYDHGSLYGRIRRSVLVYGKNK